MFRTLRWKFFTFLAVLVIAASTLSAGVASARIRKDTQALLARGLNDQAVLLRKLLPQETDDASIDLLCKELGEQLSIRYTVIAYDGRVRGDSHADPATMNNHRNRPEVIAALASGYGQQTRFSDTEKVDNLYIALRRNDSDPTAGTLRVAMPLTMVRDTTAHVYRIIGVATGVALLGALAVGLWGSRRITQPISHMIRFAGRVAQGDFHGSLAVTTTDEVGSMGHALLSMRDQLREKIEDLDAERQRLAAILSGLIEAVVVTDADRRVVYANPAAEPFLTQGITHATGHFLHEISRSSEWNRLADQATRSQEAHTRQVDLPSSGGRTVNLYVAPMPTGGLICVLSDITEQRQLDQMRIDFVANASHELKTPLASLGGALETLTDGGAKDDPNARDKFITIAQKNAARLQALVSDLLDLSRIESTDFVPDHQPVDLAELLNQLHAEWSDRAAAKDQTLAIHVEADLPPLRADGALLTQALANLIDNSIKYTPNGGRIDVTVQSEPEQLILSVADNGIGIPAQHLPRLFERFYRVDQARSRELGGTGLGLAIVKHIAHAHGGTATAQSEPNQGTTIRIALPHHPDTK